MATTKTYTDLNLDFSPHPITGDVVKKKNAAAVAGAVKNLVLTSHYERPFHPEIGSNIRKALFDPMDSSTTSFIRDEIKNVIDAFEPRVRLEGIDVQPDFDNNGYNITLIFFILSDSQPVTISVFLERVR